MLVRFLTWRRRRAYMIVLGLLVSACGCRVVEPAYSRNDDPASLFPRASISIPDHAEKTNSVPIEAADDSNQHAVTIDFPAAQRRADLENPTIGLAEEAVRAALAEEMQARALLLPYLNAGGNLHLHRGNLQLTSGAIRAEDNQSFYGGFGADAKAGGTAIIPGVHLFSPLADAIFAPQIASRRVAEASFDAVAVRHVIEENVGEAYLALVGVRARLAALHASNKEVREIVRLTENFAKAGQGRDADAKRALAEAELLQAEIVAAAEEEEKVAAAELARLLSVAPFPALQPVDAKPPLLGRVDPNTPLEELLALAAAQHPELAARDAGIAVQTSRLRQERVRPWLPTISVGLSAGEFGGGSLHSEPHLGSFQGRTDIDAIAWWTIQNFGVGNLALRNRARAQLAQAESERLLVLDRIRREVVEAYSLLHARRAEMALAQKRIDSASIAYQEDLRRAQNLQGRIIEVLNSYQLLKTARQDLIGAMVDFSRAQLKLTTALGQAPLP
jgi:outer membrane protein TolC